MSVDARQVVSASLVARFFDRQPDIASYPAGYVYPLSAEYFLFIDKLTGTPHRIPSKEKDGKQIVGFTHMAPGVSGWD